MACIPSSWRPCKQLRELLQEQQEPILQDACLYENVYPRKVTYKDNCSCGCWSSYHHSRKRAACKNGKIFFAKCSRFLRALSWTIGIERSQEAWDINGEGYGNREVDRSSCISEMGRGNILLRGRMSISSSCFDGEELDSSFLGLQHYNVFVFTDDDGAARQYNSFSTQVEPKFQCLCFSFYLIVKSQCFSYINANIDVSFTLSSDFFKHNIWWSKQMHGGVEAIE